jgi:hypothetical protein
MLAAFPDAVLHTPAPVTFGPGDAAPAAPVEDDACDPFDPFAEES